MSEQSLESGIDSVGSHSLYSLINRLRESESQPKSPTLVPPHGGSFL